MISSKPILVTGCAGFIASRTCEMLLDSGQRVVGIDNMNDYYDVRLKKYRLEKLESRDGFEFRKLDVESTEGIDEVYAEFEFEIVLNLAARAGVRYSKSMGGPFEQRTKILRQCGEAAPRCNKHIWSIAITRNIETK